MFFYYVYYNAKAKTTLQKALEIAKAVQPYIIEAEKFIGYSGVEKNDKSKPIRN